MYRFNDIRIGYFIKREKRFTVYIKDKITGDIFKGYCCNTGKMEGLLIEGSECILTKLNHWYIWQAIYIDNTWIGVNTQVPNYLIGPELRNIFKEDFKKEKLVYKDFKPDFINETKIIEVKNVHLKIGDTGYFPDTVTTRGTKQVRYLSDLVINKEVYVIYVVQREDVNYVSTSDRDRDYREACRIGLERGIKFLGYTCKVDEEGIRLYKSIDYKYE